MSNYILSAVLMVINQKQTNWETSELCIIPYEHMRTVTAASSFTKEDRHKNNWNLLFLMLKCSWFFEINPPPNS